MSEPCGFKAGKKSLWFRKHTLGRKASECMWITWISLTKIPTANQKQENWPSQTVISPYIISTLAAMHINEFELLLETERMKDVAFNAAISWDLRSSGIDFLCPIPPHVLVDFVVLLPGHGSYVIPKMWVMI